MRVWIGASGSKPPRIFASESSAKKAGQFEAYFNSYPAELTRDVFEQLCEAMREPGDGHQEEP